MSLVGKWFGFGEDEVFDEAVRLMDRRDFSEAIAAFEAVRRADTGTDSFKVKLKAHLAKAYHMLGMESLAKGWVETALANLLKSVELEPHYADFRVALARGYRASGNRMEEFTQIRRALEINPEYTLAMVYRAVLDLAESRFDDARYWAHRASVRENNAFRDALDQMTAGEYGRACERLWTHVETWLHPSQTLRLEAQEWIEHQNWDEASRCLLMAIEIAPTFPDLRRELGEVYFAADRVKDALDQFRRAVELNPRFADAWALCGVCMKRQGNEQEARLCFLNAVNLQPGHPIATLELSAA